MSISRQISLIALGAVLLIAACSGPGGGGPPPPGDGRFEFEQKLTASDAGDHDHFGFFRSVAVQGDTILVGAPNNGATYVYRLQGATWTQVQQLTPPGGGAGTSFGQAVALDGERAFIAAHNTEDGGEPGAGVVYVYDLSGNTYTQSAVLSAPDPIQGGWFGWSLDTDGDRVIVGAYFDGVNDMGKAYVFHYESGTWQLRGDLQASDAHAQAHFGSDVAIEGDTAIVGSWANAENGVNTGAAYVFEFGEAGWHETDKLVQSQPAVGDRLGITLALSGDYLLVSASGDSSNGVNSGSVRVFNRQAGVWTEVATLVASDGATWDMFGESIAIGGGLVAIGAYRESSESSRIGSVYVFERTGTDWTEVDKLVSGSGAGDLYGMSVALDAERLVVGTPRDDDRADRAGAAYVYSRIVR